MMSLAKELAYSLSQKRTKGVHVGISSVSAGAETTNINMESPNNRHLFGSKINANSGRSDHVCTDSFGLGHKLFVLVTHLRKVLAFYLVLEVPICFLEMTSRTPTGYRS